MEVQKAGDNSNQYQIGNITIQQGIDEKRAREIYDEKYSIAKRDFTQEALRIANDRVRQLEEQLIPKIERVHNGLKAFEDPSFQLLLVEAQKSAASTERPADYNLLAELLIHRIEKGSDRHVRTGINRAVEIVGDISDDALLGLTVVHSFISLTPISNDITHYLDMLENLASNLLYADLPTNNSWIEDLEVLSAIRVNPYGRFTPIDESNFQHIKYITTPGICQDSEEHKKAIKILEDNKISADNFLIENKLLPGYVRLKISRDEDIENISLSYIRNGLVQSEPLSLAQKDSVKSILKMYKNDEELQKEVRRAFMSEWDKRPNLRKIGEWLKQLNLAFNITSVGQVLARANAQRCDSSLPSIQ